MFGRKTGAKMEYSLNVGEWNSVFAVPSSVVDKYIKLAGGNSLKLLLYLIRHGGESFTAEILRAELGFEELGELEDAALFWVQRGIIRTQCSKDAVTLTASAEKTDIPLPTAEKSEEKKPTVQKAKPVVISNGEIAELIKSSPETQILFNETEKMFGRPLHQNERQTIAQLSAHYGLPSDVSLMLLGYCFKQDKATPAYISKVAENWANEDIMTVQLADEKIRGLEKQTSIEKHICEALGIVSNLSASNRAYIKTWALDWGFGDDMIMLAYNKTLDGTGKWSFAYANKILETWKDKGITTPQEAEKADEEFKKANSTKKPAASKRPVMSSAGKTSSFDTSKLRSQIMSNYKK